MRKLKGGSGEIQDYRYHKSCSLEINISPFFYFIDHVHTVQLWCLRSAQTPISPHESKSLRKNSNENVNSEQGGGGGKWATYQHCGGDIEWPRQRLAIEYGGYPIDQHHCITSAVRPSLYLPFLAFSYILFRFGILSIKDETHTKRICKHEILLRRARTYAHTRSTYKHKFSLFLSFFLFLSLSLSLSYFLFLSLSIYLMKTQYTTFATCSPFSYKNQSIEATTEYLP